MKKHIKQILALTLSLAVLLTACNTGGTDESSGGETPAPETSTTAPANDGIVMAVANEGDGYDPTVTVNSFSSYVIRNCFEGLMTTNEKGEVVPALAESYEVSTDGTVYTYKIKPGLTWSDGEALDANDFVYSIKRVLDPNTLSRKVDVVLNYIVNAEDYYSFMGGIEGAAEIDFEEVGVKAIDDLTLELTLTGPIPYFNGITTDWVFFPVQEKTVEANGDQWAIKAENYITSGPFKVEAFKFGESIVLVKNENYWDAANVKLDGFTIRFIPDTSTSLTAYETGEINMSMDLPAGELPRLRADANAGLTLAPQFSTTWLDVNNEKAPLDNPLVRKALNLAIDREQLVETVLQGMATPAPGVVPEGYLVDGVDFTEARSEFEIKGKASIEEAQAALAEAGYPGGEGFPKLVFSYYTDPTVKQYVEVIQQMWKENLGIEMEIASSEWKVYYADIQSFNYDIGAMGMGADYLHPMSFLESFTTGSVNNHMQYANPAYDALIAQVGIEQDPAKALTLMLEAEEILINQDFSFIPLYGRAKTYLVKSNIKGTYFSALGAFYLKGAYIEDDEA